MMKDTGSRSPTIHPNGLLYKLLPWVILLLSLAITVDVWRNDRRRAEDILQNDFDFHVHEALGLIQQRMAAYQQVLRGAEGLFASSDTVSRDEFLAYVTTLQLPQTHPGIRDIGFAHFVPREQKAQFIAGMRKSGEPAYNITPDQEQPVYAPLAFHVTLADNGISALGFDLYSVPMYRSALEHALDHRTNVISGKVALSSGGRSGPGFAMYAPVFRKHPTQRGEQAVGWIGATVRIETLMAPQSSEIGAEMDIEIYDGEEITGPKLMFDSDNWPMHSDAVSGRYRSVSRLQVANHVWTVAVRSLPAFEARLDRSGTIKAWFGAGISILLAIIAWQLAGSRARALEAAREMNLELIERERRYRQMFEDSASIAFLLDPANGRIVDANEAAVAFWGYSLTRLRRMRIEDIDIAPQNGIHELMREATVATPSRFECRHRLVNGELRDVELYAGTLGYQKKTLIYCILHDITARKQAELAMRSSEERYRLIAENTGDVIWMMDTDTLRFTYISPSIKRQRGYTPEEVMALHRHVLKEIPAAPVAEGMPQMGHQLQERIRNFVNGDESQRRQIKEIDQPHKDGRIIPVEVASTLLCDENNVPRAVIGVSRDISARRQAQEEQKRFVAMVSHEFRTPLATIDGAVQRLLATTAHVDEATRHRFDKIQKAADRLTALLDDYLTQECMDTVGQGLHLSLPSPLAMLQDCAFSARALSAEHAITVDAAHLPQTIQCDVDRLRLALRILTDNAVKYTPAGSTILLQGRYAAEGGIKFIVTDNGNGIPESELPHVFDKFFRGRRASQQSGSGLGLHMARAVVEMHGGTLTACNHAGGGACFTMWIPAVVTRGRPAPTAVEMR